MCLITAGKMLGCQSELKIMEIFRSFLSTEHKLYLNIEMVIQVLCDAATSMSMESIVESWVSIYEADSNKHRPISNERAEKEICEWPTPPAC